MKSKVLVAEDDAGINKLIGRKIAKAGHHVLSAMNGEEAIGIIEMEQVDLMLLDYQMPRMNGEEVIAELVKNGHHVPFIIITGNGDERIAVEMMKKGACDYLVKDAEFLQVVTEKVSRVLKNLQTGRELEQSQRELKESEKRSQRILDAMKDPVYICSDQYEIQYMNPAMKESAGEDHHGQKCYEYLFDRDRPCEHCLSFSSEDDAPFTNEVLVPKANRIYQQMISPIRIKNGDVSKLHIIRDLTEIINARKNIEQSERQLRLLAENAVDIVWQMDLRLNFTYMSPSAERVLGYKPEELTGKNLRSFCQYRDFVQMARQALAAIRNYRNFTHTSFESWMLHKDGTRVPVEITGKVLRNKEGKLIGLQGATRDISERRAAQEEQLNQYRLIRTLIDNIPDTIYVKDLEGRFLLNNKAHQINLGVKRQEDLTGKTDFDFFDEDIAHHFREDEQKIIETGTSLINKEEFKRTREGNEKWSLTTKVPLHDSKGNITGIAGINKDITSRKEAEDEVIRSRYELSVRNRIANAFLKGRGEKIYDLLVQLVTRETDSEFGYFGFIDERGDLVCPSMTFGIWDKCEIEDKSIVFPKENWAGLWGRSLLEKKPLLANSGLEFPEGHIKLQNALCVPVLINKRLIGQIVVANKHGGYKNADMKLLDSICSYVAPILDSRLKEKRMAHEKDAAFDELKVAKEKAEESDKLKSAFLLNLSHEVRTPLNAIMGFSRLLSDQFQNDSRLQDFVKHIDTAGRDLMKVIDDTIHMAKLENRQVELSPGVRNIRTTVNEIYEEFSTLYEQSYPDVKLSIEGEIPDMKLHTDHEKLKKILFNLLENAGKFTVAGNVWLGCTADDEGTLKISVRDDGIGIQQEMIDLIFDKFTKIETNDVLYRGNGLGLSISKGLAELLGGSIGVESEYGKGSVFELCLPVRVCEPVAEENI